MLPLRLTRAGLFLALFACLTPLTAQAARVTWTWSGTAFATSDLAFFPSGSLYTVAITYESSTPSTAGGGDQYGYVSAILGVTFDSAAYHLAIPGTPLGSVSLNSSFMQLNAGANPGLETPAAPRLSVILGDVDVPNPSHLPIFPPSGVSGGGVLDLFVGGGGHIQANVKIASIAVSIPEPRLGLLAGVLLIVVGAARACANWP